jgi:hypothetical protein
MDYTVYVIALNDPHLAREAERQALVRRGLKAVLKFNAGTSMDDICRGIRQQTLPRSTSLLKKLHICAHGEI